MIIHDISDKLRDAAIIALTQIPDSEVTQWMKHPCTAALVKYIQSEVLSRHAEWAGGAFSDTSVEGTAQLNAQAIGAVDAFNQIEGYIQDMFLLYQEAVEEEEKDDNPEGA